MSFISEFGYDDRYTLAIAGFAMMLFIFVYLVDVSSLGPVFAFMVASAPIWLPIVTFYLFFEAWMLFVRLKFDVGQGRTTLEIKIPQEIFKSPEAMEIVLTQLHQQANPDNHIETYIDGKHPPVMSLEVASHGGDVRFYLSVPKKKIKNLIETQMYSQYPGIEVHELDVDYTAEVPHDLKGYTAMTFHIGLKKADAYPLKTYIDFGLDKMPKEEEKVDPISSMLEMMGNLKPGENIWFQIMIDANRKETFKEGQLTFGEKPDWTKEARKEIDTIIEIAAKRTGISDIKEVQGGLNTNNILTDTEKDTIKAIERSTSKNAFNTAIRYVYVAKDEAFNAERIPAMLTALRNYDDNNRNALGVRWRTDTNWKFQNPGGRKVARWKLEEIMNYKRRSYYNYTSVDAKKIMTTEELATIFHLPGKVVTTPTLGRIPSKRSEAPSNLPIG